MKHKKIISTVLFAVSGTLLAGFVAKTGADYVWYTHSINSAPFILWIAVNALCFITPAAIVTSAAMYIRRWKRALLAVTLAFAAFTVLTVIVSMPLHYALADGLLYSIPFALSAMISGILTAVLHHKKIKA